MKLAQVLERLNSFEKNQFIKLVEGLANGSDKLNKQISSILEKERDSQLKNISSLSLASIFAIVKQPYIEAIEHQLVGLTYQHDLSLEILMRDGNCIMKKDWFSRLYEKEFSELEKSAKEFDKNLASSDVVGTNKNYRIYRVCVHAAFFNDRENNRDPVITKDEKAILTALSSELDLTREEVRLLHHSVLSIPKTDISDLIRDLRDIGLIFYSKSEDTVFVPDEFVAMLRFINKKEVADKHFRRVLRHLSDPQINAIAKRYNIEYRKRSSEEKIADIIQKGISLSKVLLRDIQKEGASKTEIKSFNSKFIDEELNLDTSIKGATADDKVSNLIEYFNQQDDDDSLGISVHGYEKLLLDIKEAVPGLDKLLRYTFDFMADDSITHSYLMDFNIRPSDVLYLLSDSDLKQFCQSRGIKSRGNLIANILEGYKDANSLYIENYVNLAQRDVNALKSNGLDLKEANCGVKFEEISQVIFSKLGFSVDQDAKKDICNKKNYVDFVLSVEQERREIILVECKTFKSGAYSKFSSVSRQVKAYIDCASAKGYKVVKSLIIAPEFSDEFVRDCGLDIQLNLSLLSAPTLISMLKAFENSKLKSFPVQLLLRDMMIKEDLVVRALQR